MQNYYQQGEWIKLYRPIYAKIDETHVYRTDNAFRQIEKKFSKHFSAKKQLLQGIPDLNESKLLQSIFGRFSSKFLCSAYSCLLTNQYLEYLDS